MTRVETESALMAIVNELANQIRAMRLEIMELRASLKKKRRDR